MKTFRSGITIAAICLVAAAALAQDPSLRARFFADADAQFEAARAAGVDALAPKSFNEALKYYQRAETKFIRGEDFDDIRGGVARARSELRRATEAAEISGVTLAASIEARTNARSAEAGQYAPKLWTKAEEKFAWAVSRLEGGSIKQAQTLSAEAEQLYRQAELDAIKANYLTGARTLIARAEQMRVQRYAPKTLDRARQLLQQAEWELADSRYDLEKPRNLAAEAQYEASHAIYLAGIIKKSRERQTDLEDLLLDLETPVREIGASLDLDVKLDAGYAAPTAEITRQIDELRYQVKQLELSNKKLARATSGSVSQLMDAGH